MQTVHCRSTNIPLLFPSEQAKRNVFGGNAQRLLNLRPIGSPDKLARRAASNGATGADASHRPSDPSDAC